jgi:outer membrane protein TolC
VPVSVKPEEAFRIASENRLDWMNRKAQLVDSWRKIDITADKLKGVFDLKLNGSIGTLDNNGVHFGKETGSLDVRFEWDTPLTRYNEMMDYRKSQIDYQKARRDYYTYIDSVQSDLRTVLRDVQMSQINFEINRNAVLVGTIRVDLMQLRMEEPPQRGGKLDPNTSQQLVNALDSLTKSQNDFLNTWVTYQTQRMLLDLYMGTMSLDDQGRWIEPSGTDSSISSIADPASQSKPVPILPRRVIETSRLSRRYVE